jgi:hypothetical protein
MQALRRIAQLVKAQCSDVIRMGKPVKLRRSSSFKSLSSKAGVHLLHGMEEE